MSLVTIWGYNLIGDITTLQDIITAEEFNNYTGGKYSGDARIASEIKAASQAIRNYCGWHIWPSAECSMSERLLYGNGRMKRIGHDLMIQMPTRYMTAVSSVVINEKTFTNFDLSNSGTLIVFDVPPMNRKSVVTIVYTSGIPDALMDSIKELVAQMVTLALAKSYGVTSEAAGGVSITYNSAWANGSFNQLLGNNAGLLSPYRLEGVF